MNRIIAILTLLIPLFSAAQSDSLERKKCSGSLAGRITDQHNKLPLEYVTILIVELGKVALTDSVGNYSLTGLCDGTYTVDISRMGIVLAEQKITVKGKTTGDFNPESHSEFLSSVEIIAEKSIDQTTQTENLVSGEKLDQAKGQSLGDALKSIPGVNTLNTGNSISKPVIHGLHSNRILILNNGIRQEGQQWGIEHAPEIDPFIAGRLSVVKGANGVRYGSDAMAGVVLVEMKPLRDSAGVNGELNMVGMTNGRGGTVSAYADGKFNGLKSLSWRLQGTLKQSGNISAPDYMLVNTGIKEYNFSNTLLWSRKKYGAEIFYSQFNTTLGIFGASHIGNLTDLQTAFHSSTPLETGPFSYKIDRPYQHIEHELFKFRFYFLTGDKGKFSLTYARQYNLRYEYDKHRPLNDSLAGLNHPELQFEITTHTTDLVWEHNARRRFSGSVGISGITQGNTYEGRALIPNFRNYSGGIFLIERWRKNKLELEGGIRYDYKWLRIYKYEYAGSGSYKLISPIRQFGNVIGNAGAIFKPDSTLNLSVNFGSAWRAPSISELYSSGLHHGAAAIEYGNDSLRAEVAYNANFTLRFSPGKRLFFEVSPYFNYITDFIYRKPTSYPVLTIRGAFPAFNYEQTDALLKGCDLYVKYKVLRSLDFTGKASILRAWNQRENNWLIMMPSDRYEGEFIYRLTDLKNKGNNYVSASLQYVTRQWRVPANSDFVPPPGAYFLLGFHASCSVKVGHQNMEIGVSVFNALNDSYRDYLDRFRYYTDAIGRNVSVRVKVPFGGITN